MPTPQRSAIVNEVVPKITFCYNALGARMNLEEFPKLERITAEGSNFVNVDDFAFGAVARYLQLDREQCCFPPNLAGHTCKHRYKHAENGTAITWDDALQSSMHHFEHKSYNLFTCNCHSFVANCLNRLCYGGSMDWNMINVVALVLLKGHWVDSTSILRSFFPFIMVLCMGIFMVGWPFVVGLLSFSLLLIGWFLLELQFVFWKKLSLYAKRWVDLQHQGTEVLN
ncbi:hypothetical protein L1049_018702 [Liquidambar formosana]|uniref:Uncharacterized protein n=1 Tax=Liquidambar formosana TaxID=63359 RepID=A0AAP0RB22_LIQFO